MSRNKASVNFLLFFVQFSNCICCLFSTVTFWWEYIFGDKCKIIRRINVSHESILISLWKLLKETQICIGLSSACFWNIVKMRLHRISKQFFLCMRGWWCHRVVVHPEMRRLNSSIEVSLEPIRMDTQDVGLKIWLEKNLILAKTVH